tara:strand:- start:318 stop:560 length:243 start_codon:yes stop_codon:yes gene_type:complete
MDCKHTFEDVEKIEGYASWSEKKKIDTLLHIDCVMYSNLGSDSTKGEVADVKKKSRVIYKSIKNIRPALGESLIQAMDKK